MMKQKNKDEIEKLNRYFVENNLNTIIQIGDK